MKEVVFIGGSRRLLKRFPDQARIDAGHQLWLVQQGFDPEDWKPMQTVGRGVREIRIHKPHEHRVIYVAHSRESIYVLHAFEKKTRQTPQYEIEIARAAYAEVQKQEQKR